MADEVIYEENDILTERNLGIVIGQPNIADYRIRGCTVTLDPNNDNIDVASADPDADAAVATDNDGSGYILLPDERTDRDLATVSADNYVYLVHNPTASADDDISLVIQNSQTAPSGASVLIATVDPVADTVDQPPLGGPDVVADDLTVHGSTTINGDSLSETVEDIVAAATVGGDKMSVSYDDGNDQLTIDTTALDNEEVQDATDALLSAGPNLSLTYDDANDDLQIDTSALNEEEVEDAVAALLTGGDKISLTYDDANDTVTVDTSALDAEEVQDATDALLSAGPNLSLTYDDANDDLQIDTSALNEEEVEDAVAALLTGGDKISLTYDDANDTVTVDTSALDAEEVRDEVAALLDGGTDIDLTYDDAGDTLTVEVSTDAITADEIDESIAPTWTAEHTFSGGITGLPSPTDDSDAARKAYVDTIEQGLDIKDSVRAATDGSNIDLTSATDPNPIDGVTLSDGDRILLKDQTDGTENGLYQAVTATDPTTWTRTADADEDSEVTAGLFVFVEEGTANLNRGFVLTTDDPITVGTTSLAFTQFSGAGQVTAGDGLSKTGDRLDAVVSDLAGVGLADSGSNDLDVQQEQIEDWVGALVTGGTNVTVTYDDANDQLTVDTSALNEEEVEDAVSALLASSSNLAWSYDDANDILTVSLSGPITGVQIGTSSSRQDGYFATADANTVSTDDTTTKTLVSNYLYAGAYDGSDVDARLDAALTAASTGDEILLERGEYAQDRTINTRVDIVSPGFRNGADLSAVWTIADTGVKIESVTQLSGGEIVFDSGFGIVTEVYNQSGNGVTANADGVAVTDCFNMQVTFASGTADGFMDSCWGGSTFTDNSGNNNKGDVF